MWTIKLSFTWKNPNAPIITEWWLQAKKELSIVFLKSLPENQDEYFVY
jgi:hypothetical protein